MRLFKKKHKRLTPTGRVINMTRPHWGHNLSISRDIDAKGRWRASVWVSTRPKVGDEIAWAHEAGTVKSIITKVDSTPNVWDMYFIEGTITHLNEERIN